MSKQTTSRSSPIKGTIVISFLKLLAYLPLSVSQVITKFVSSLLYITNSKSRKITETNLRLCFPSLTEKEIDDLTRNSIYASGQFMAETSKVWLLPAEESLPMIHHIEGEELITEAGRNSDKGLLIISLHLGNWELIYAYLAHHYQSSGLYRPPKIAELEKLIIDGRRKGGGEIIKTTKMEVRKMLRVLKKSDRLFLLPDQQPQRGSGVFAPFYGHQAYTMTLLQGLVQRTNADIVMSSCIRTEDGFKLAFSPVEIDASLTSEQYAEQLNLRLQQEIDKAPEQYEWAYKRFKASPDGVSSRYT